MKNTRTFAAVALAGLLSLSTGAAHAEVPRCPNVLVTFDASGTMKEPANNSQGQVSTRFVVGREAVAAALQKNALLGRSAFRYGLQLFGLPGVPGGIYANCGVSSATCSYSSSDATCRSVQAASNSSDSINAILSQDLGGPSNDQWNTPTSLAVATAGTRADMQDASRSRYQLLITDGGPNCVTKAPADSDDFVTAANSTVEELNKLRDTLNVKTFVVGFGLDDSAESNRLRTNLNRFAVAGGTSRVANTPDCTGFANKCFYEANDGAQLDAALASIVEVVGGEFGGGGCDDSCYAQGCGEGQVCSRNGCVADPCAGVSCAGGTTCVSGTCKAVCNEACRGDTPECVNGQCVAAVPCSPSCSGENTICVQGQCVENLCAAGAVKCPGGLSCIANACQPQAQRPDSNPGTGNGNGGEDDNGTRGGCSGTPGALSLVGILLAVSSLGLMRPRRSQAGR